MTQSSKWRARVAEFVAVVLAVVVGLAADEWRQSFQDRALEASYLSRMEADLASGRERIEDYRLRFQRCRGCRREADRLAGRSGPLGRLGRVLGACDGCRSVRLQ